MTTPDELARIESKLDALIEATEKLLVTSDRVEKIANLVGEQVKPVLDEVVKSPLLKMLGVKMK